MTINHCPTKQTDQLILQAQQNTENNKFKNTEQKKNDLGSVTFKVLGQ